MLLVVKTYRVDFEITQYKSSKICSRDPRDLDQMYLFEERKSERQINQTCAKRF